MNRRCRKGGVLVVGTRRGRRGGGGVQWGFVSACWINGKESCSKYLLRTYLYEGEKKKLKHFPPQLLEFNCLMLMMMLADWVKWELTLSSICLFETPQRQKNNLFVWCVSNQIFSAKGVVVPWWQCELGLGVAAAVKSGLELNNFLIKSLTSTFLM